MDLPEFLLARIAEHEARAREIGADEWLADLAHQRVVVEEYVATAPPYKCDRQRRIHEELHNDVVVPSALAYADHPDFDPAWAPDEG